MPPQHDLQVEESAGLRWELKHQVVHGETGDKKVEEAAGFRWELKRLGVQYAPIVLFGGRRIRWLPLGIETRLV